MIRIDDSLLDELGLMSLPKSERDAMLRQIYETLEMRVGMKLAERMSEQQLDEFERFIDTNDEAGALKWLETNFPDYKQVVADELEKLKAEIKQDSGKIVEAMQAQAAPAAQQPQMAPAENPGLAPQQPPQPQPYQQPVQPGSPQPQQSVPGNVSPDNFSQPPQGPTTTQQPPSPYDQNQQPPMAA